MDITTKSIISPPIFHNKASLVAHNSIHFQCYKSNNNKSFLLQLQSLKIEQARKQKNGVTVHASAQSQSSNSSEVGDTEGERWLLVPVGDGDTRHIGFDVKMPGAFEIASSNVTVGRLPDKADMVIPVATVSGLHARIQKRGGNLVVTDLDSTNGTFVNEKRLRPGVAATAPPGSSITFGDIHLAMFRVSKLEKVETSSKPEEPEDNKAAESES